MGFRAYVHWGLIGVAARFDRSFLYVSGHGSSGVCTTAAFPVKMILVVLQLAVPGTRDPDCIVLEIYRHFRVRRALVRACAPAGLSILSSRGVPSVLSSGVLFVHRGQFF